jgi:hypothetical protein
MPSRPFLWFAIFVGSAVGGFIPQMWGDGILSYWSVLLSGIGAIVGMWIAFKI